MTIGRGAGRVGIGTGRTLDDGEPGSEVAIVGAGVTGRGDTACVGTGVGVEEGESLETQG